jgi:hypothetical protein
MYGVRTMEQGEGPFGVMQLELLPVAGFFA